jgi:octopine/nopaline transport system ATP-binding protein
MQKGDLQMGYHEDRQQFLDSIRRARGWFFLPPRLCPAKGPKGDDLFMDTTYLGAMSETRPEVERVLVILVGTHGVEGPLGSYTVQSCIDDGTFERLCLQNNIGVLIIHAVNPYGWAYGRRVNEDNVDLNRNGGPEYRTADRYEEFPEVLMHSGWGPDIPPRCSLDALKAALQNPHGGEIFSAGVAGQHRFPEAIFYGGTGPSS